MGWGTGAVAAVIACLAAAITAHAEDTAAWLKDRQTRFAAYQAAHPHPDAEIADVKAKTAALIAAYRSPRTLPALDSDPVLDRAPLIWKVTDKPLELWDGPDAPEMIVIPAGEYTMGSPVTEPGRQPNEDPRHRVRIDHGFAVGKFPITVGEFSRFVAETGYQAGDQCYTDEGGDQPRTGRNWRRPSFDQASTHPAVCVNDTDARAYLAWLSRKTGHAYRLLSEAEYEYATRAGSTTAYWWGDDPAAACAYANAADLDTKAHYPYWNAGWAANNCHDGYVFTAPVGSFKPNAFGLYDMTGETWSLLSDCWNASYDGAPADGSANTSGDCSQRSRRGGSWNNVPEHLRAALRFKISPGGRYIRNGFRIARTL